MMEISNEVIIVITCSALAIIGCAAIFAAIFYRKLGTSKKRDDGTEEQDELLETQQLAPAGLHDRTEIGYTTTNVQPARKQEVAGYPHGDISSEQPIEEFYDDVSDESSDEIPNQPDAPELTTTLTILLRYDRQRNYLLLKLINLFDLPVRRDKTLVNVFLEIRLLPHFGNNPIQTGVHMSSSNPKLDETFEFEVESDELSAQKLEFVVMDAREYSNRSIGCAVLSVGSLNMSELLAEKEINTVVKIGKPVVKASLSQSSLSSDVDSGEEMIPTMSMVEGLDSDQSSLQARKTKGTVRLTKDWDYVAGMEPMILLSLNYEKQTGKLFLAIVRVSDLQMLPNHKKPDTYVKVLIYIGKKLRMKKKTAVVKNELNPTYNQKLQFSVSGQNLEKVSIELVIKNNAQVRGKPASIHKILIGNSSTGNVLEHWKSAITSGKPVTMWHNLN